MKKNTTTTTTTNDTNNTFSGMTFSERQEMFDREMRFPLRDRWNSVEEAKTHTVKAYQTCLNHALRMNWIKER